MYSYTWDEETGGLLLNNTPLQFSKEPRPVYYREMDILGFDRYFKYEKNDSAPYMWAEANNYIYRGQVIAQTTGGSVIECPLLKVNAIGENKKLKPVDMSRMIDKNSPLLEKLEQDTIKHVYNIYKRYKKRIDVFYVAFSGGKDSIVTLDIVQKALPHDKFKVLFGDTGMEFPDTYETTNKVKDLCNLLGINFITAKSHLSPEYTWRRFGPPATVNRWCCSVHKTAPQILTLRKEIGKNNFTGLAFVGIRASESLARSTYDYISLGEKHQGQYSCNPILEWNSAELFLYIYRNNLIFNEAYKKGNRRAGCLTCPRAAERNEYFSRYCYKADYDILLNTISELYRSNFTSDDKLRQFVSNGGWKARKNGRDLSIRLNYEERISHNDIIISISEFRTDWKQWIKTLGTLTSDGEGYCINFRNNVYKFKVVANNETTDIILSQDIQKENPNFVKLFKSVFRKSSSCIMCKECEANCHNGCIHMDDGNFYIDENCTHCTKCHDIPKGCLVYKSLEIPKSNNMLETKSLNSYSHHAPKIEWIEQFFTYKNDFPSNHTLGSNMYSFFRRFLRDAGLIDKKGSTTPLVERLSLIGMKEPSFWGVLLCNLAYTPQINWFVTKLEFESVLSKDYTLSLLVNDGAKESWVSDIWSSLFRLVSLPFGEIGLGKAITEKGKMVEIRRIPWQSPVPKVILYSLYKFAEACGGYYQFSLTRLLDTTVESDGVSPTQIFGLDRDVMVSILKGLSMNYPEYISTSFTLDLDSINLKEEKTSEDVLNLF